MNESRIWGFLVGHIGNPFGSAGVIGNLYAESGLNPINLQNTFERKLGYTDESYTAAVDNGSYSGFVFDGAGYGIAQWTYWSRKNRLLSMAREQGKSIGDLDLQLDVLWAELQASSGVLSALQTARSVREASDIVLTKYERPADQSEAVKVKRAAYGQRYYDLFAGGDTVAINYDKYLYSTGTHYISNSGKDENSGTRGGAAGDQTGHEWELKKWYNRPWTVVLRYPDQAVALTIAKLAIAAALNNKIGYDQGQRTTYWAQLKAAGYDPSKITTACEDDCTAGVSANVRAAGYIHGIKALQDVPICTSRNMRQQFIKAGFKALTDKKYLTSGNYELPGDILLYENHHAATNITLGAKIKGEWRPGEVPTAPKLGDRDLRKGDKGDDVKELQEDLMKLGWSFPKYGADGDFGSETESNVKGFQRTEGLPVTGIFDHSSYEALMLKLGKGKVEITGNTVNVRTGPGTNNSIIGVAKKGERFEYGLVADGWYQINFHSALGWVSGKYAKVV